MYIYIYTYTHSLSVMGVVLERTHQPLRPTKCRFDTHSYNVLGFTSIPWPMPLSTCGFLAYRLHLILWGGFGK